jgi:hypothetical protein
MEDWIMTVVNDHAEVTHNTELKGIVYEDTGEMLTDHDYLKAICPDVPDALVDDLVQATKKYAWGIAEGYDEYHLFREEYAQIKQVAVREHGLTALELYDRYMTVAEAAVLKVTNWGDTTGDFLGSRARESSEQWMMRQQCTDSFAFATDTERILATGALSNTASNFPYHIIPQKAVGTWDSTADYYTTINDKQMLLIFYYESTLSPRVLETVAEHINDSVGWRAPFDVYSQLSRGNEGIATRPGCLVVDDGKHLSINAWCLINAETDILPQGVDIITRDQIQELNK